MSERVKVDAGQVQRQEAWCLWECIQYRELKWRPMGSSPTKTGAMKIASVLSARRDRQIFTARYIGDPEAVVVSREHPEGVPVEWTGGES